MTAAHLQALSPLAPALRVVWSSARLSLSEGPGPIQVGRATKRTLVTVTVSASRHGPY